MKNVHVFVPVFLYAVTMLIFQMKRIISSEKWCNFDAIFFFFLKMPKIGVGRTTVNGQKKEDGLSLNFSLSLCGNNISRLLKLNFKQGPLLKENITQDFLSK